MLLAENGGFALPASFSALTPNSDFANCFYAIFLRHWTWSVTAYLKSVGDFAPPVLTHELLSGDTYVLFVAASNRFRSIFG